MTNFRRLSLVNAEWLIRRAARESDPDAKERMTALAIRCLMIGSHADR